MSEVMEKIQNQMTAGVNDLVDEIDRKIIRQTQKSMFTCCAGCFDDRRASREHIDECLKKCSKDLKKIQSNLESELGDLQVFNYLNSLEIMHKNIQIWKPRLLV